ncbi:MAG: DinB family protein [Flavipsychrobacter sp.]|nr:DinB family protein [Flavipsychrobacter sp.]
MTQIQSLLKEMEHEAATTKKFLSLVPADKFDYKPHPKSMPMKELATHIAEIPAWIKMVLTTEGLDFAATPYVPTPVSSTTDLLALQEKSFDEGYEQLSKATEADFERIWTMRQGDVVFSELPVGENIRHCFCQIVHHRAQLGVYLRLLNIPIPGSYGPSADEMGEYKPE